MNIFQSIDNYRLHELSGIIIISIYLSFLVWRKWGAPEALLVLYTLISAGIMYQSNLPLWGQVQMRIEGSSAVTHGKIVLGCLLALTYDKWRHLWQKAFTVLIMVDALLLLMFGYGIFNASSLDAAIIACAMPMILLTINWWEPTKIMYALLPAAAILRTASSTSYFVLLGCLIGFALIKGKWKQVTLAIIVVTTIGYLMNGDQLLNSSRRVYHWTYIMEFWWTNMNHWLGAGIGSFDWLGPASQMLRGQKTELFMWMHNDYLQLLYEGGFIGLLLGLAVWVKTIIKSWKSSPPWVFITLCGLSVCMLSYYPMHFFLSQTFMLAVMLEARCEK